VAVINSLVLVKNSCGCTVALALILISQGLDLGLADSTVTLALDLIPQVLSLSLGDQGQQLGVSRSKDSGSERIISKLRNWNITPSGSVLSLASISQVFGFDHDLVVSTVTLAWNTLFI